MTPTLNLSWLFDYASGVSAGSFICGATGADIEFSMTIKFK